MVASVDQGCSSLELVDKVTEEMRLIGIVKTLDTSLGDYTAVIRLGATWLSVGTVSAWTRWI